MREDSGTRGPEIRRGGTNGVHFDHCSPHRTPNRGFYAPGNHNKNASDATNSASIRCRSGVHSGPKSSIQAKTAFPDLTFHGTRSQRCVPELPFYKIKMRRVTTHSVFANSLGDIFRDRLWHCLSRTLQGRCLAFFRPRCLPSSLLTYLG